MNDIKYHFSCYHCQRFLDKAWNQGQEAMERIVLRSQVWNTWGIVDPSWKNSGSIGYLKENFRSLETKFDQPTNFLNLGSLTDIIRCRFVNQNQKKELWHCLVEKCGAQPRCAAHRRSTVTLNNNLIPLNRSHILQTKYPPIWGHPLVWRLQATQIVQNAPSRAEFDQRSR